VLLLVYLRVVPVVRLVVTDVVVDIQIAVDVEDVLELVGLVVRIVVVPDVEVVVI
jgi:hypothetical protein